MPLLEAKSVKKLFGGVVALSSGSLTCEAGRITGLLGTNGSGKSTISKIITGVYAKDGGTILYEGREIAYKNPNEARMDGISMVFQNLSLIPDLTVWQNIALGNEEKRGLFLDNASAVRQAEEIIGELLPGLDVNRRVCELNPGEQQITEIAKAISVKPKLLIFDEPTAALEQEEVKSLFAYMRKLAKEGVAMIFTSHRLWEVLEICDDIVVFRNGENTGAMDFSRDGRDPEAIVRMITGETEGIRTAKEYHDIPDEPALTVQGLTYGKYLQDVSFRLRKGEVLGIGGLAGQGQNELMLALAGSYPEASGSVEIGGRRVRLNRPSNAVRSGVLLVPGDRQKEGLFARNSIYYNMIYPKLGLKKQPFFTPEKQYRAEAEEICRALSVRAKDIDVDIDTLSGGNQQKIVVGKWLPFDIKVLLLADPAKGVDVGAKRDLYEFIMNLVREKDMSVILYASDSDELISYCDRLLIMYEGQVVSQLTGPEITEDNIVARSMRVE